LAIILPTFLWAKLTDKYIQLILFATIWMGVIGLLDDYLKVIKKYPKGLIARYKMAGQISLGLIVGIILFYYPDSSQFATSISIPFIANGSIVANGTPRQIVNTAEAKKLYFGEDFSI